MPIVQIYWWLLAFYFICWFYLFFYFNFDFFLRGGSCIFRIKGVDSLVIWSIATFYNQYRQTNFIGQFWCRKISISYYNTCFLTYSIATLFYIIELISTHSVQYAETTDLNSYLLRNLDFLVLTLMNCIKYDLDSNTIFKKIKPLSRSKEILSHYAINYLTESYFSQEIKDAWYQPCGSVSQYFYSLSYQGG